MDLSDAGLKTDYHLGIQRQNHQGVAVAECYHHSHMASEES
jgi:hypothetical protein